MTGLILLGIMLALVALFYKKVFGFVLSVLVMLLSNPVIAFFVFVYVVGSLLSNIGYWLAS